MKPLLYALVLACIVFDVPASAKVIEVSDRGFVVRHQVDVPADEQKTWDMLLRVSEWWDSEHTWSGAAANMSIDPRAGGCFCETLPDRNSTKAPPRGSVEHMRVVFVERLRTLRMVGVLGPLQAEAANGTMTIQIKPAADGKGAQVQLEYIVGGFVRMPYEKLAPAVDGVLGDQLKRLLARLGDMSSTARAKGETEEATRR